MELRKCFERGNRSWPSQLSGGLPDGEEERLQPGEVPHELEDAQDLGHAHQPHNLARLADDVELGEVVDDEVDEVGEDGEEVDQVHRLHKESHLLGTAGEPREVLDGEEDRREVVDDLQRGE